MKAIYKNIALAALAFGAAACSQEDDFSLSYLNDSDAVRITAQVGTDDVIGGFTRSNPLGTVDKQKEFNTSDQIAVTAGTQAPVVYQLGTDGWTPVGETYLKWQTNEMSVTAYYPVDKNKASATTFSVPTEYADVAAMADADYMIYSGTQSKGDDKAINLTMQRKMVRIVVDEISFNDQFAEDYSVTAIKVHSNTTGYADGEPVGGNIEVSALQQDGDFYALLAPTTEDEDATFLTVTVTNNTNPEDVHTLTVKGIPATIAGNSYNYSLTVGKDVVSIGNVTVTDWKTGEIIGGVAEELTVESSIDERTLTMTVYKSATSDEITSAIANALNAGCTTLDISLPADTDATMFSAITAALAADDIAEGSIDLTISGAKTVPEKAFCGGQNIKDEYYQAGVALKSVSLPDATEIGRDAFYYCVNMTSVSIPEVVTIGRYAFSGCDRLASISAPKCETLKDGAFSYCTALSSVYMPVAKIIDEASGENSGGPFCSCGNLTEISLPEATTIGELAFAVCEN